jgi:hypothetical protein
MSFHDDLQLQTAAARRDFMSIPTLQRGAVGDIGIDAYTAFLGQAYHHVRHTVPLLMACGARLPRRLEWLRQAVVHYVQEEVGHEEWILNDIRACGADADAVREGEPHLSTELMVSYAYDGIARGNPVSLFGMVMVLEGTSVQLASSAASAIGARLGLPAQAFSYLTSHGSLDQAHIQFFKGLVDRLDDSDDRDSVSRSANVFYQLYGNVFRALPA